MKLKHYLIASENNDYKPWVITSNAVGVFCLIVICLRFLIPASFTFAAGGIDAADVMNRINDQRRQRFIQELQTDSRLTSAAGTKAQDMLARSYFAHINPDGEYVWPTIQAAGFTPWLTLGENLAMDFTEAGEMVNAWMNSPTHRANIVNEKFEEQGLSAISGTYEPGHNTIMVVSLFGTLAKTKSTTTTTPPPPAATPTPRPIPTTNPTVSPVPSVSSKLVISKDIKVDTTNISGHMLVNIDLIITGNPTLVTAKLNSQSISLIAGASTGEYKGSFTFDTTENLSSVTLTVEARDKTGAKTSLEYPLNIETPVTGSAQKNIIPVSNEAQIIKVLRIIFGIFATIYMIFLVIDTIIVHRAKIKRDGIRPHSHLLVFVLLAAISLFGNWF